MVDAAHSFVGTPGNPSASQPRSRLADSLVGIALGLLFDSLLLVATTGWLAWLVVPLILPVLIGVVLSAIVRWPPWPFLRARHRSYAVIMVLIVWPVCATGPVLARKVQLLLEAHDIPLYAGGKRGRVHLDVIAFDNAPGFSFDVRCAESDFRPAIQFYYKALMTRGWHFERRVLRDDRTYYVFTKPRRALTLIPFSGEAYELRGGEKPVPGAYVRVQCTAFNLWYP